MTACTMIRAGSRTFRLARSHVPFVRHYFVLHAPPGPDGAADAGRDALGAMWRAAYQVARRLAERYQGDPECFSVLFNGGRTRRRPWPHFHIVITGSLSEKRRAMVCISLKRLLRWWRWPVLRRLVAPAPAPGGALGPVLQLELDEPRTS
jgi:hypothetical protein